MTDLVVDSQSLLVKSAHVMFVHSFIPMQGEACIMIPPHLKHIGTLTL